MSSKPRLKAIPPRIGAMPSRLKVQSHAGPERDKVRAASVPWRQWYKTARWRQLRLRIFARDLFTCQWPGCGRVTGEPSHLVCDHVRPHRGDEALFWDEGNLQTLCKPCHDSAKQREERSFQYRPEWLSRARVPVTLVCGPPMAGKSAYAAERARPGDVVIDLDAIACEVAGIAFTHDWDRERWLAPAMRVRNDRIARLSKADATGRAWLIIGEPEPDRRQWWVDHLGVRNVVVIEAPEALCIARLNDEATRPAQRTIEGIAAWWRRYRPRQGDEVVRPN